MDTCGKTNIIFKELLTSLIYFTFKFTIHSLKTTYQLTLFWSPCINNIILTEQVLHGLCIEGCKTETRNLEAGKKVAFENNQDIHSSALDDANFVVKCHGVEFLHNTMKKYKKNMGKEKEKNNNASGRLTVNGILTMCL
jgi:hypothetical protein